MNRSLLYSTSAFRLPPLAFRLPPLALFSFTKRLEKILWHSLSIVFTVACENNRGFRCVSQGLRIEPMWIHPMWGGCLLHQRRSYQVTCRFVSADVVFQSQCNSWPASKTKNKTKLHLLLLLLLPSSLFVVCYLFIFIIYLFIVYFVLFCFVVMERDILLEMLFV